LLIGIGLLAVVLGIIEHGRDMRVMRAQYPSAPRSMSAVLAMIIAALGLIALVAVIFRD
jgi:putative membrane protein